MEKKPRTTRKARSTVPDIETIAYKVADVLKDKLPQPDIETVEATLLTKLMGKLDIIGTSLSETVEDVRKELMEKLSTMESAVLPMVEKTVETNMPAMCQIIAGQLEKNVQGKIPQSGNTSGRFEDILSKFPSEFWVGLVQSLFGKKQQTDIGMFIKGAKFIDSLKSGDTKGTIESLEQAVKSEK